MLYLCNVKIKTNIYPFHDVGNNRCEIMKYYNEIEFVSELACRITMSEAHYEDSHRAHRLAVYLASVFWKLDRKDCRFTETEISSIVSCLNKV